MYYIIYNIHSPPSHTFDGIRESTRSSGRQELAGDQSDGIVVHSSDTLAIVTNSTHDASTVRAVLVIIHAVGTARASSALVDRALNSVTALFEEGGRVHVIGQIGVVVVDSGIYDSKFIFSK